MRIPVPSERAVRLVGYVAVVLAGTLLAALLVKVVTLSGTAQTLERQRQVAAADRADLRQQLGAQSRRSLHNAEAARRLANQVRGLGEKPVTTPAAPIPSTVTGPTGDQGTRGERGPAGLSIIGPRGPRGATGLKGDAGRAGGLGSQGLQGVPGEAGPPGPAGPQGETGPRGEPGERGPAGADGKDGSDGRGVTSVTCSGPPVNSFTFTYSDGTTQTVECALAP